MKKSWVIIAVAVLAALVVLLTMSRTPEKELPETTQPTQAMEETEPVQTIPEAEYTGPVYEQDMEDIEDIIYETVVPTQTTLPEKEQSNSGNQSGPNGYEGSMTEEEDM